MIIKAEWKSLRDIGKGLLFCMLGIVLVAGIIWANGRNGSAAMKLGQFSIGISIKLRIFHA